MVRATAQVIGVCLAVFAVQTLLSWLFGPALGVGLFALALPLEIQPWTLATSVYAHYDTAHLLGNLALFAVLGLVLERNTTRARFHAFVLVTGALAGLAQVYLSTVLFAGPTAVLGLSGAVFAMLGYVVAGNRLAGGLLDRLDVPAWGQLLGFAVLAGAVTLYTASNPRVALIAHFTGFLLGLLAGQENLLRASAGRQATEPSRSGR